MPRFQDPFADLTRIQNELDRIFRSLLSDHSGPPAALGDWDPPTDIVLTRESVRVLVELPGVAAADLDVEVAANSLTLRGHRHEVRVDEKIERFHCVELPSGRFLKTLSLPDGINSHAGRGRIRDGVLEIEFPRIQENRGRAVQIPIEETQDG